MSVSKKDLLLTNVLFTGFRVGMVHYMVVDSNPLHQGLRKLLFTVSPTVILYNYVNVLDSIATCQEKFTHNDIILWDFSTGYILKSHAHTLH